MSKLQMTIVTGRVPKELVNALKDEVYGKGNHIPADDQQRCQVLAESFAHFAGCRGSSCRQGRMECRENCVPEMACTAGEDRLPMVTPNGRLAAIAAAVVAFAAWVGFWVLPKLF